MAYSCLSFNGSEYIVVVMSLCAELEIEDHGKILLEEIDLNGIG